MTRRELREHIFKMIFRIEFYGAGEIEEQMLKYVDYFSHMSDLEREYLLKKAGDIYDKKVIIDKEINRVAEDWETSRMGKVDLSIIRLALYEILFDEEIPTKVAINEAVEAAKVYGGDSSPAFINAILAKLAK
jgi:transcription antitermination factor NusB